MGKPCELRIIDDAEVELAIADSHFVESVESLTYAFTIFLRCGFDADACQNVWDGIQQKVAANLGGNPAVMGAPSQGGETQARTEPIVVRVNVSEIVYDQYLAQPSTQRFYITPWRVLTDMEVGFWHVQDPPVEFVIDGVDQHALHKELGDQLRSAINYAARELYPGVPVYLQLCTRPDRYPGKFHPPNPTAETCPDLDALAIYRRALDSLGLAHIETTPWEIES